MRASRVFSKASLIWQLSIGRIDVTLDRPKRADRRKYCREGCSTSQEGCAQTEAGPDNEMDVHYVAEEGGVSGWVRDIEGGSEGEKDHRRMEVATGTMRACKKRRGSKGGVRKV